MSKDFNRREFIGLGSAALAAGLLVGCSTKKRTMELAPFSSGTGWTGSEGRIDRLRRPWSWCRSGFPAGRSKFAGSFPM